MSKREKKSDAAAGQLDLFTAPGAFDDDSLIRGLLTETLKSSAKSRDIIADEISELVGRPVTAAMLYTFTAESKENHRWPLGWTRALCQVTGDWRLLRLIAERAGLLLVDRDDARFLELGRAHWTQKQAAAQISELESNLGRRKGDQA